MQSLRPYRFVSSARELLLLCHDTSYPRTMQDGGLLGGTVPVQKYFQG